MQTPQQPVLNATASVSQQPSSDMMNALNKFLDAVQQHAPNAFPAIKNYFENVEPKRMSYGKKHNETTQGLSKQFVTTQILAEVSRDPNKKAAIESALAAYQQEQMKFMLEDTQAPTPKSDWVHSEFFNDWTFSNGKPIDPNVSIMTQILDKQENLQNPQGYMSISNGKAQLLYQDGRMKGVGKEGIDALAKLMLQEVEKNGATHINVGGLHDEAKAVRQLIDKLSELGCPVEIRVNPQFSAKHKFWQGRILPMSKWQQQKTEASAKVVNDYRPNEAMSKAFGHNQDTIAKAKQTISNIQADVRTAKEEIFRNENPSHTGPIRDAQLKTVELPYRQAKEFKDLRHRSLKTMLDTHRVGQKFESWGGSMKYTDKGIGQLVDLQREIVSDKTAVPDDTFMKDMAGMDKNERAQFAEKYIEKVKDLPEGQRPSHSDLRDFAKKHVDSKTYKDNYKNLGGPDPQPNPPTPTASSP